MKTYYVYHLNCDCQSEDRVYDYKPKWVIGPKCQGCKTTLEDSQVSFSGKFRAKTRQEALKQANKKAMDECHKLIAELKNKQSN